MSKLNNKSSQYKTEIKNAFKSLNPDNNEIIEANQLNDCNKIMNFKQKNPFLYNSIKSLTSKKSEENDEYISSKEYISYIDNKLNDDNENIFNIFCEGNKDGFSLTKLAKTAKELGDDVTANKMMKLIEQAKLFNKEITLDEFQDILNDDYDNDNNIKSSNESEDFEEKENSNLKLKKEEEDKKTISSKNEDPKENEADKTNKRYHRRYRDTKNKSENNDKVNNNNKYKGQTKYRKNK
jgi:Ca2+-binding EF-hand superfamily protein